MKVLTVVVCLLAFSVSAFSSTHVRGTVRRNGHYVQPHYRTSPNRTRLDNYSTKGNVNPYTGKRGTKKIR